MYALAIAPSTPSRRVSRVISMLASRKPTSRSAAVYSSIEIVPASQPTVSHHMARLREAGLVEVTKRGIWSFYSLARDLPTATRRILDAIG
jgi:DNA-binding transcriptional ArsR family regulator